MTEYPQDAPTMSAAAPPVMYSDYVYDYPETGPAEQPPASHPSWLPLVAVIGVCIAVIVVVIAVTVTIFPIRPSERTTVISVVPPTPPSTSTVTSVSTMTAPPPHAPTPRAAPAPPRRPVLPPPVAAPSLPMSGCPQRLVDQAAVDYVITSAQAVGSWVPQLSSKRSGLVADGITWDCEAIWAEHMRLRRNYNAKLLWSGDWPQTYRNDDYWVTVAGMIFPDAEGARQWCVDHGRDIPEHCYPSQIR